MVTLDTNVRIYYLDGVPEIAATVEALLTRNARDFKKIDGLSVHEV